MSKAINLWAARIFAIALAVVFGCSDSGGGLAQEELAQEEEKDFAGKTNDGHDLLVFNPGDLDEILFKIDTVYITDTSFLGRLFFRNLPASKTPEPGDIINSSITKNTPYGFLYRVTEVAKEDEEVTIVYVSYASIAEAVEEADIEFEIPLVYDEEDGQIGPVLARCWVSCFVKKVVNTVVKVVETVVDALAGNWDIGGTKGQTFSVNKGASFGNSNNGGDVRLDGSYTLSLTTKIKLKNYSLDYAKMSIAQNKYLKLEGNLKGSINREEDFALASFRLPDIEFMVGPVYVYLKNDAIIKAKVEAKVQTNMNASLTFSEFSEYGFEYNGSFKRINTCGKDFDYNYRHSTYGSVRLGVLVGFSSMFYGVAGLEASAGPSVELKSPLLPLSANSQTSLNRDLDVDVKVKLQFLDFLSKSWNFGSVRTSLGSLSSSKTLPSFNFISSDFDLKGIASGKLSFPFKISKPNLGFSVEESGFCIEAKEGECIKGPGFGLGKLGNVTGNVLKGYTVNFENLAPGTYNIIPYFKSSDGEIYYDMANAVMDFSIDNYCGTATFDPKTQFCSLQELKVYSLCGGKDYNTLTQFCSSQVVYDLCGGKSYNPSTQFCSSQVVYDLCGGKDYNPSAQFCSGNALYDLCGGKSYNLSTQFCSSQVVYDLCGGSNYNPSTHFCFGNVLYDLCGSSSYNPSTQFCFNKTAYPKCDGKSYDPSEGEMCCGAKVFNNRMQRCSNDIIVDKEGGFVNDEQGNSYGPVKIGEQTWLDENLNINVPGSRCYDDDPVNCRIYGRLYDWATAMNLPASCNTSSCSSQIKTPHQGICPKGWHIPSYVEWDALMTAVGGVSTAGTKLKARTGWRDCGPSGSNNPYLCEDTYGFSALPGGGGWAEGSFANIGNYGSWWSANETEYLSDYADRRIMNSRNEYALWSSDYKSYLFSVRCLQD
jgi:uncharacterized protein (TIGR02145 family)